ncbi:hypothetical protein SAMN05444354_1102 [Stigmatella aurantiaca]|uniref:Uncharacterized protein n=1 Tax=Stigmatella aurantiaca TaxID=41 RepID=A0A1H7UE23_STIAU|nr:MULTISPECIES: hypothetical protein [Stigmatella]SEL94945.1 hypothetical protein SAMN05444354_1102 [Stigmatella aurantiaca]
MRETIEFRVPASHADQFLEPELGTMLGDSVRKIVLPMEDPRVKFIADLDREFLKKGRAFFTYSHISRHYTRKELEAAELLQLLVRPTFEPPGEMCGTQYDDAVACPHCGAGAKQLTDLHLDVRRIPKKKALAVTIAGELVVAARLAEALLEKGISGADYRPVKHQTGKLAQQWRQLVVTSKPVDMVPPTCVGDDPFDLDERGRHRCPQKHVAGLNRLSELWLKRAGHDGSDWVRTRQLIGARQGVLRPREQLLISPRLYRLLLELKASRFEVEVAHWV